MSPAIIDAIEKVNLTIETQYAREQLHKELKEIRDLCGPALVGASRADQVKILREIAFLLGKLPGNEQIWSWLKHLATCPNPHLKDALVTTIFELVPDDPLDERDLACLWSCIDDMRTRWVIAEAYAHQRRKLYAHFVWHLAKLGGRKGVSP